MCAFSGTFMLNMVGKFIIVGQMYVLTSVMQASAESISLCVVFDDY